MPNQVPVQEKEDKIFNGKQTYNYLNISKNSLRWLVHSGQIPYIRLGKRTIRFSRNRLDEWLRERESPAS